MSITPIFFDTGFLVALHGKNDSYHDEAVTVMERTLSEFYPFARVLTDYILDEVVTGIKDRGRNTIQAIEAAKRLRSAGEYRLDLITPDEFEGAYLLFTKVKDKGWSFTDCTSYVWMQRHEVRYAVSMDKDFDQFEGVENLVRRQ